MQDKFNICEHDSCTACSACQSICHKHAITMITDDDGFQYPYINEDSCVECGLCIKTCPANKELDVTSSYPQQPYLAWINDEEVRLDSSSGGIFTAHRKIRGIFTGNGLQDVLLNFNTSSKQFLSQLAALTENTVSLEHKILMVENQNWQKLDNIFKCIFTRK